MEEIDAIKQELEAIKKEIISLTAENLAVQFIFIDVCRKISAAHPEIEPLILQGFDSAADLAEDISIILGRQSGHTAESLRVVEQLRLAFARKDKPKHGV